MSCDCAPVQYALVAYVRSELGEFVEELRRELHPAHAHLPTHIYGAAATAPARLGTGRHVHAAEPERHGCALPGGTGRGGQLSADHADGVHPGESRGLQDARAARPAEPGCLWPSTNPFPTCRTLRWPNWMTTSAPQKCCRPAKSAGRSYRGSHRIDVERLTFVRGNAHTWRDLAEIALSASPR